MLGYPELAVGDAYKACLLCDAGVENNTALGQSVMLQSGMAIWFRDNEWNKSLPGLAFKLRIVIALRNIQRDAYKTMIQALGDCDAIWNVIQMCKEAGEKFPQDSFFAGQLKLSELTIRNTLPVMQATGTTPSQHLHMLRSGGVIARPYPWMESSQLTRDDRVLATVRDAFEEKSGMCTVDRSSIGNPSSIHSKSSSTTSTARTTPASTDVLGVFATQSIRSGDVLMLDATAIGVCNTKGPNICGNCCCALFAQRVRGHCCDVSYCSSQCQDLAMTYYHKIVCNKDFGWLYELTKVADTDTLEMMSLMFLRFLALCVQNGSSHPLDHPLVARLTSQYGGDHRDFFSLTETIIQPIKILQRLGVDVFADLRYDTWVVQTIWTRIANNKHANTIEGRLIFAVNPLFSFFNHSCEPNVEWEMQDGSNLRIRAKGSANKGEELFVSYLNDVDHISKTERQTAMMPWLGRKCRCSRCRRER